MREFRKDRRGLRNKISPLLPREDYKISHIHQLSDMRECGKILKSRMSLHARFWVAPSGFRTKRILVFVANNTALLMTALRASSRELVEVPSNIYKYWEIYQPMRNSTYFWF